MEVKHAAKDVAAETKTSHVKAPAKRTKINNMSHRVHPYAHRLGIIRDWKSRWFSPKNSYKINLKSDILLREFLDTRFRGMYVSNIEIERGQKLFELLSKLHDQVLLSADQVRVV